MKHRKSASPWLVKITISQPLLLNCYGATAFCDISMNSCSLKFSCMWEHLLTFMKWMKSASPWFITINNFQTTQLVITMWSLFAIAQWILQSYKMFHTCKDLAMKYWTHQLTFVKCRKSTSPRFAPYPILSIYYGENMVLPHLSVKNGSYMWGLVIDIVNILIDLHEV